MISPNDVIYPLVEWGSVVLLAAGSTYPLTRARDKKLAEKGYWLTITPPDKVDNDANLTFWKTMRQQLHPWWKALVFGQPYLIWELRLSAHRPELCVWAPECVSRQTLKNAIESAWIGAKVSAGLDYTQIGWIAEARLKPLERHLHSIHLPDPNEYLRGLIGSTTGLTGDESVVVSILAQPSHSHIYRRRKADPHSGRNNWTGRTPPASVLEPIPAYIMNARISVASTDKASAKERIHGVCLSFGPFEGANRLHRYKSKKPAREFHRHHRVSTEELAALAPMPTASVMRTGRLWEVVADETVPREGKVLGTSGGRDVALSVADSRMHVHITGNTGVGKALAIDTPILTVDGWTTMANIQVGDEVFDENGNPCRVVAATEVMNNRSCSILIFDDESSLIADDDHQWLVWDRKARVAESRKSMLNGRVRKIRLTEEEVSTVKEALSKTLPGQIITRSEIVEMGFSLIRIVTLTKNLTPVYESVEISEVTNENKVGWEEKFLSHLSECGRVTTAARKTGIRRHTAYNRRKSSTDFAQRWKAAVNLSPIRGRSHYGYDRTEALTALLALSGKTLNDQRRKLTPAVPVIKTTKEIRDTARCGEHSNYSITTAAPVQHSEKDLLVDPYTLGVWLGDGTTRNGGLTCADPEIVEYIRSLGWEVRQHKCAISYGIIGLQAKLRILGVLRNKHIPAEYMYSSVSQRRELLAGLLDTDGGVEVRAACISSSVKVLADGILELALSLGYKATMSEGRAMLYGKDCGPNWTIRFPLASGSAFKLTRKVKARDSLGAGRAQVGTQRYIVDVQETPSTPVRCIQVDSPNHMYLAGSNLIPTHNSVLMTKMILQDIEAGRSVVVIDWAKGDMIDWILERYPVGRENDLCLIDPLHPTRAVGLDVLTHTVADLSVEHAINYLSKLWTQLGDQQEAILRNAILLLSYVPGATLMEIPTLLDNDAWRKRVLDELEIPDSPSLKEDLRSSFISYGELTSAEKRKAAGPLTNKLRSFLLKSSIRFVLGQSYVTEDPFATLEHGGVILARVPKGSIGQKQASLLSSIITAKTWEQVMSRSGIPELDRYPTSFYADEIQNYLRGSQFQSVEEMLTEARGWGMGVVLAHQFHEQLIAAGGDVAAAVASCCRNKITFAISRDNAKNAAKTYAPMTEDEIARIPKFNAICLPVDGTPYSFQTIPLGPGTQSRKEEVTRISMERWGREKTAIEQEIIARKQNPARVLRIGTKDGR